MGTESPLLIIANFCLLALGSIVWRGHWCPTPHQDSIVKYLHAYMIILYGNARQHLIQDKTIMRYDVEHSVVAAISTMRRRRTILVRHVLPSSGSHWKIKTLRTMKQCTSTLQLFTDNSESQNIHTRDRI